MQKFKLKYWLLISNKNRELIILILICSAFIISFFDTSFKELNQLTGEGERLKGYYETMYHVKYDTSYFRTNAMNYPYGEMVLYTGEHFLLSVPLKLFSEYFFDISNYTIAIINSFKLLSYLIGAIIIYLIFIELQVKPVYALLFSFIITFLSPQIMQEDVHLSLSYVFVVPVLILYVIKFYHNPSYKYSLLIGFCMLMASLTHFYYFGFYSVILFVFWLHVWFMDKTFSEKIVFFFSHFFFQFLLPFTIIQFIFYYTDFVTDRSLYPIGYLENHSSVFELFLPLNSLFFQHTFYFKGIENYQETFSYLGSATIIILISLFFRFLYRLIRFKKYHGQITNRKELNILAIAAILALLYSLGIPFIFNLEHLLDYISFLKQTNSIKYFSWVFFYIMNIIAYYFLFQIVRNITKRWQHLLVFLSLILLLLFDFTVKYRHHFLFNYQTTNYYRTLKKQFYDDNRLSQINPKNYQAIIPLPYFHVGSENIYLPPRCEAAKHVFSLSLVTGIPTNAVWLSRTSINQSFENLQLIYEPYRLPEILQNIEQNKKLLILTCLCADVSRNEQRLINHSKFLFHTGHFCLYEFEPNKLMEFVNKKADKVIDEFNRLDLYNHWGVYSTDSLKNFIFNNFQGNLSNNAYTDVDAYEGKMIDDNLLYNGAIQNYNDSIPYILSFWFKRIRNDLYPKTMVNITLSDSLGNIYQKNQIQIQELIKAIDDEWALIEYSFKFRNNSDKINITLKNKQLEKNLIIFDELLIRPLNCDIYIKLPTMIGKNNRYFYVK